MVLNPIRKDDYTAVRIALFCNQLYKFILVLTTNHMSAYKVWISGFKMNLHHNKF
jgi:hypothetical protein